MDKLRRLYNVSDPNEVNRRAQQLHLNPVHPSSQARFKYMVFNGNKMVHFGSPSYQDYTKHHDERRRNSFNKRNARWKDAPRYSPAFLSYWLLWN
jgi:hypothetical protein